jgi:branched-chain amino acid transport system permease protein
MTLGLSLVLTSLYCLIWSTYAKKYAVTYLPTGIFYIGNIRLPQTQVYSLLVIVAIFASLYLYARRSKQGLAMQAMADDVQASRSLGIRATRILPLAWILSAVVAMAGGYLLGNLISIDPSSLPTYGINAIAVMFLGGMQSIEGAMIAGPIVGILEFLCALYIDPLIGGGFRGVFPYLLLIIILLVRPQGLFGWKTIERI